MIINQCVKYFFDSSATLIANDQTFMKHLDHCIKVLWLKKKKKLIVKTGLLKQMWNIVLKLSSVVIDRNNSIEK